MRINFLIEMSLFIFTSCAKFHFCCEIIFSNEISLLVICIHFSYKWEMGITKQMNIKNRTYYFYNDLINIKDFDPKLLKLDKKSYKNIETLIFITLDTLKKNEYKINSVNPLYLLVHRIDGFIEEKRGNKYLNIAFTDSNNEVLKKVLSGIKGQIEKINSGKLGEYEKDYMKIKFNSDDNLSLNKQLKFPRVKIIVRRVFEEDGKYYPQVFLDECLYEV